MTFSNNLKWTPHIDKICRRNLKLCPTTLKLTACKTLIRPVLEYRASIWVPHQKKDKDTLDGLEIIQRRATRFMTSDYYKNCSVTPLLKRLKLVLFYKIVTGLASIPVDEYVIKNTSRSRKCNIINLKS